MLLSANDWFHDHNLSLVFKMDELGSEILCIAFPAALALAADPIASLIDTAFIGHLGLLFIFYSYVLVICKHKIK